VFVDRFFNFLQGSHLNSWGSKIKQNFHLDYTPSGLYKSFGCHRLRALP
jgi:hypothetical protein